VSSVYKPGASRNLRPSSRIDEYLNALAQLRLPGEGSLVSIILFGSAANGAFRAEISDVDLIIVLPDGASPEDRTRIRNEVAALEILYGFSPAEKRAGNRLEKFAERAAGHSMSYFICGRGDLLSGEAARLFGLSPIEAVFVDRIVYASVIASAVTVWGEDLLPQVSMLPIRRLDVFKSLFNLVNVMVMSAMAFLTLPDATRYAMSGLKHSVHNCYFCYHLNTAPLDEEIDFFNSRLGQSKTLDDLLEQRRTHKRSFGFILRCVPTLFRLHLRTAWDIRFPRDSRCLPEKG
jgi:Nucleotidyltransferase domain